MNKIKRVFLSLVESLIRNIGGGLGQRIRYMYYKNIFKKCGKNVKIDVGVIIENPENISVGNNVWFLSYSIITSRLDGMKIDDRIEKKIINKNFTNNIGEIIIGNEVAIGAYNIIQGYGGLYIGDKVTTSAKVAIYSYSHYPYDSLNMSKITYANSMCSGEISCVESPIVIKDGVWLGLGVTVFGGTVGENSFVTTNSVILNDLPENSYASGTPAKKIKNRFDYEV